MKRIVLLLGVVFLWSCVKSDREQMQVGQGNNCLPDISNCDISGNYSLVGADISPFFYSANMPIAQETDAISDVVLAPYFYFYTISNTYLFRSIGNGTWDGDSLKATIHGKLRLATSNYPVVGGFSITVKFGAKQKTFTSVYYNVNLSRTTLPTFDGMMILSDSAHVVFPVTDTATKVLFTQF